MPTQHLTSRRHAELLRHLLLDGGAAVKDLRLRRVVPLTSAPLDDSSPDPAGPAAKSGSAETTPPEAQDGRERKPVVQRSKLVHAPASFGYRRLLPFLNQLTNTNQESECPSGKDNSKIDAYAESESEAQPDPVHCSISTTKEEINISSSHLSSTKMCLSRCQRSRFVHHPSSFSYKRMLPFVTENEITSQEGHRTKIPRLVQEKQSSTDENLILTTGQHHFVMSGDSAEECKTAQVERLVEENESKSDRIHPLGGRLLQPAVSEAAHLELQVSTVEGQNLTQERVLASDAHLLSSDKGECTLKWNDVLPAGQHQPAASEDFSEESNKAGVEAVLEERKSVPDGNSVLDGRQLQTFVSKASPPEGTAEMQKATQKQAVTSDGDDDPLDSCKGGSLAKEQPLLHATELSVKDNAEGDEVHQCQSPELGTSDVCFGGPTKVVIPSVNSHNALEQCDSMASLDEPLLDVEMTCIPLDPCATGVPYSVKETPAGVLCTSDHCSTGTPLTVEETSSSVSVVHIEPMSSKVSPVRQRGSPCLEKRGLSPKKLSPKKGILKRHTRGCKGICMCLDCSTFRLRADRAFEFSRKQMQEADDIIDNLLKEVSSLRNLMEKSAGQQETKQTACQRASQVEVVARERRRQMLMELNSHCRIPGPRVKFAQYVEERMASSPSPDSPSRRR
ncbi:unknown protein [Oryza sativa Japonica Group]|uniref:Os01g0101800 protein n=3 Tax=Oryza sativa TaxID=4530 RepID=Q0JRG9_ORYSJ|nr:uncharacterized protein LOC4326464 isoform X1 [Oryza sativa Japonica Group]EEC69766.1 hypothetical protein OsI_00018 [Oryza sativa Indica Group]EEE53697.1 hypothetical protein OsJ_00015 [Oryza sativa Japonica Group]KAF2947872.1 hypothetical protein DAI22_01g001400 [Oryza sativa Japonica Group]BAD45502.1 unknown protein [Oryza sativa Japonica Group]BAF03659.1 Os01g0101800 [Oryza sativa Japonica Group]|eukprot:NP_001041745.1 Os01g0101800 [Oryza sativa Japonica Group]